MATKTIINGGNLHYAPTNGQINGNGFIGSLASAVLKWQERASMRYQLAELDKEYLTDMGLSHTQVKSETDKAFWQS